MECGKLTAKLRDAVPVCFMVNDREVKRYKNIEIPAEIKHLEYCGLCFVNRFSAKSEKIFPVFGLGIPYFRNRTWKALWGRLADQ